MTENIRLFIGLAILIGVSSLVLSIAFDAIELPQTVTSSGGGETPPELPTTNIVAWYDADDGTTISIGVGVSQWDDKSGNGNHLVQSTGTEQPTVSSGAINGKDAIYFDGVDDSLEVDPLAGGPYPRPMTIAMVTIPDPDLSDTSAIFSSGGGNSGRLGFVQQSTTHYAGLFTGVSFYSATAMGSDPVLLVVRQNATHHNLYVDGDLALESTSGSEGLQGFRIGSFYNGYADAEIKVTFAAVYDDTMSDEDLDTLEDYVEYTYDLGMTIQGDYGEPAVISATNSTWTPTQELLGSQSMAALSILVLVLVVLAAVVVLRHVQKI